MAEPESQRDSKGRRMKRAVLAAFAKTGSVTLATQAAKADRRSHYNWLRNDEAYAAAFKLAQDEASDLLEQEARRRAVEGVRRLKFTGKGEPVIDPTTGEQYFEHEYSDVLLIFMLKGNNPAKFKDHAQIDHTNAGQPFKSYQGIDTEKV